MSDLLFHQEYEDFYRMAAASAAFSAFCQDAFGADLSQDGFSDVHQLERILPLAEPGARMLDMGCGNGGLLGWLQTRLGGEISGFDYSEEAIRTAQARHEGDFRVAAMGEAEYPPESFDLITAMDTVYFAPDMTALIGQVKRWLRPGGVFFCGYTEGEVQPRTADAEDTVLAGALRQHGMRYQAEDITEETYRLLLHKRACALAHRDAFLQEGNARWADMLLGQTDCILSGPETFRRQMARYLFVARK